MKPFRWNLARSEQLGGLLAGDRSPSYSGYREDLVKVCAKVFASCANCELVFVGRSPENIFDYLSGVFEGTSWRERLHHLNISNRGRAVEEIRQKSPANYQALLGHFRQLGITHDNILHKRDGIVFVDLVYSGGTYEQLARFLVGWASEDAGDVPSLLDKTHFLALTIEGKPSPKAWRWNQHAPWIAELGIRHVRSLSVPYRFWSYLGNDQLKVALSNPHDKWADDSLLLPPRLEGNIKALRRAYDVYQHGTREKIAFADRLASQKSAQRNAWYRDLITELRKVG